jgi:hypothetical protein
VNFSRFPIGTTDASRRWRQLGALTLCCGEKSSHQKTGLDVGIVKSAVADPADVLAGYVSKMWSQARNSLALDGLDGQAPTGIETDVQSLQAAWKTTLKIKCPHCGKVHKISVRDTYINSLHADM